MQVHFQQFYLVQLLHMHIYTHAQIRRSSIRDALLASSYIPVQPYPHDKKNSQKIKGSSESETQPGFHLICIHTTLELDLFHEVEEKQGIRNHKLNEGSRKRKAHMYTLFADSLNIFLSDRSKCTGSTNITQPAGRDSGLALL